MSEKATKKRYEYIKEYRQKNLGKSRKYIRDYQRRYKTRMHFTHKVARLVKQGKLIRATECVLCGSTDMVQACTISESVFNPLFLCYTCNKNVHLVYKNGS